MADDIDNKKLTEVLYEHNLELAQKNETLSLLEKLYQTSILAVAPEEMADKIALTIREDLNLECAGIFNFSKGEDSLTPLVFSKSERLIKVLEGLGFLFKDIKIVNISKNRFFQEVVYGNVQNVTNDLEDVWGGLITHENLEEIKSKSHIKTILAFPLMKGKDVLGVLLLGLNRDYETLNKFEREAIKSFINVISLSLDKAYLYKELEDANEKLKSLDKLKTEFLSLASHQLRSPLTAIVGYTSMLSDGTLGEVSPKQKESIDKIFESGRHLIQMVEDLLNVAKIEQGGMQFTMAPFDFEKTSKDISGDLSIMATKKNLTLDFITDGRAPYTVNGDMEKIRQVILNLVDNSIKYTKEGSIHIKLAKDENSHKILWSVTDTGMGVSPEIIATLFQKFSRGEGGKVNTGGSGLGLYLAKKIIEAHKGRIWVESAGAGKGSTFFVELDSM